MTKRPWQTVQPTLAGIDNPLVGYEIGLKAVKPFKRRLQRTELKCGLHGNTAKAATYARTEAGGLIALVCTSVKEHCDLVHALDDITAVHFIKPTRGEAKAMLTPSLPDDYLLRI